MKRRNNTAKEVRRKFTKGAVRLYQRDIEMGFNEFINVPSI
jgi:hypothetical protein